MGFTSNKCPNCGSKEITDTLKCLACDSQLSWNSDATTLRIVGLSAGCPKCNFENPSENRFCAKCAQPLTIKCPVCKKEHPIDTRVCPQSGIAYKEFNDAQVEYLKLMEAEKREYLEYKKEDDKLQHQRRPNSQSRGTLEGGIYFFLMVGATGIVYGVHSAKIVALEPMFRFPFVILTWVGILWLGCTIFNAITRSEESKQDKVREQLKSNWDAARQATKVANKYPGYLSGISYIETWH